MLDPTIIDLIPKILKHRGNSIYIPDFLEKEYKQYSKDRIGKLGKSANASNKKSFFYDKIEKIYPDEYNKLKNYINSVYSSGYGLKKISKYINLSYTNTRALFSILKVDIRKLEDSVTDKLKESRSEHLKQLYKNRAGWFNNLERRSNKTNKGIQGYYYNKSKNSYVWQRSTYEFIYAKFLDRQNIDWDIEVKTFQLSNTTYRPDFFIYENGELKKIIEIKGYWASGEIKTSELSKLLNIDIVLIKDISPYIENNSNYSKQIKIWKKQRLLELK